MPFSSLSILEELKEFMEPDKLAFLILANTREAAHSLHWRKKLRIYEMFFNFEYMIYVSCILLYSRQRRPMVHLQHLNVKGHQESSNILDFILQILQSSSWDILTLSPGGGGFFQPPPLLCFHRVEILEGD